MNECLYCGWSHANSKVVQFNYSHATRTMQETDELGAINGNLHASTAALIMMCIFGIIGLIVFIFETMLGVAEIIGR